MLSATELGDFITRHLTRTAFRLETLDAYEVATDGSDFARYLAGEPEPTRERKQPWLDHLRAERARGITRSRVHLLTRPLSPYLRYECEWGYAPNVQAGEDVRILDLTDREVPPPLLDVGDFWIIDDQHVLLMHYDAAGRFVGAEPSPDRLPQLQRARDTAIQLAETFTSWWAAHPEEWRENWAA